MSERDTDGAMQDMRMAYSYFEDWSNPSLTREEENKFLALATKYIESARSKDPEATVALSTKYGVLHWTINELAAQALINESVPYFKYEGNKKAIRQGLEILRRALAYDPGNNDIRERIADACLDLYDHAGALAMAREAVKLNPTDIDARKFLDRIEAARRTPPTFFEKDPPFAVGLIGAGLIVIAIFVFFSGSYFWGFALFLLSGPIFYVSNKMREHAEAKEEHEHAVRGGRGRHG